MKIGRGPSPSRLTTFDMCTFKYWLTYHTNETLKSNFGAEHGSLLHDILEFYVNGQDRDWRARLYRGYQGVLETLDRYGEPCTMPSPLRVAKAKEFAQQPTPCDFCPYNDKENSRCQISHEPLDALTGCPKMLFERSVRMLEDVFRRYDSHFKGKVIGAEYQCLMPIEGLDKPLTGIFDLVLELDEDTVWIVDYKTGVKTYNYDELMVELQPLAYGFMGYREFVEDANNKGFKYKNVLVTFDYFQAEPITIALTAEQRRDVEVDIRDRTLRVQAQTQVTRIRDKPETFWKCKYLCDVDVCKRKWQEKIDEGRVTNNSFEETDK